MSETAKMLKDIWPYLVLSTAVVVGIGLLGRQQTGGSSSDAGSSINKRKNFLYRADYGDQDLAR